jgi:wobble nucleotide-excising tRNase
MITDLHMDAVASFKDPASLVTDKKVNLVYGLNGTGKSTISSFLYAPNDGRFIQCRKVPEQTVPILVYNQPFIQDNFFVADSLKGIFSLSKENKVAEEKISKAAKLSIDLVQSLQDKRSARDIVKQAFSKQKQLAIDEAWKIKSKYSGGDRVLEYCLEGLKGQKEKLFDHLQATIKPDSEPQKTIQSLRDEVEGLNGDAAQPQTRLPLLSFLATDVESDPLLARSILGNTDSEVAALIDTLGNADWVKRGLPYLPGQPNENGDTCPFCQENTINSKLVESLRGYFDETYQQQIDALGVLKSKYVSMFEQLLDIGDFTGYAFAQEHAGILAIKYQNFVDIVRENISKIDQKIDTPKAPQSLADSTFALAAFNLEVGSVNQTIDSYNERLKNRASALTSLRNEFWAHMRWQYDQTISRFELDRLTANHKLKDLNDEIIRINSDLVEAKEQIASAQKETVNVDAAVDAINGGLLDLGIDDFRISKHSNSLYRVVRSGEYEDAFHTLSEGEKMMISFLYFCELCKGKASAEDPHAQRIVVIDDPISSLSHVFVFNVGRLIQSIFFKNERFSQVFVLTHSLYFFYELTDTNHERRKQNQKLFRISKSSTGSSIREMKYEEIQNDYQAYWAVVNDPTQPAALIANCMRNIVEYFFGFVRKKDLNNVFLIPELQTMKFQAFCRYINRESHSLGQNIVDMKEFNYDTFREGFKLVFETTGYPDHFKEMSKV